MKGTCGHASPFFVGPPPVARGPVSTSSRNDPGRFTLDVTIPPDTTATVWVPAAASAHITGGGKEADQAPGVKPLRRDPNHAVYTVESGRYPPAHHGKTGFATGDLARAAARPMSAPA